MAIYIDEFRHWAPTRIRCFKAGSSHLTADTVEELHAFADQLGLRRSWFQDRRGCPHYDLSKKRWVMAVKFGAVFKPAKEQARTRLASVYSEDKPF